jgi:hypothetical protein
MSGLGFHTSLVFIHTLISTIFGHYESSKTWLPLKVQVKIVKQFAMKIIQFVLIFGIGVL